MAGNEVAAVTNTSAWAFETKALSTTIVWTGATTDSYINNSEKEAHVLSGIITHAGKAEIEKIEFWKAGEISVTTGGFTVTGVTVAANGSWSVAAGAMPVFVDGTSYSAKIYLKDTVGTNPADTVTQSSKEVTYDLTTPTVSITDNKKNTATGDVTYTFTFDETVTGFTANDVSVTGGTAATSFATTSADGKTYTLSN